MFITIATETYIKLVAHYKSMKRVMILVSILLLLPLVSAEGDSGVLGNMTISADLAKYVEQLETSKYVAVGDDTFTMSFHSLGTNQTISIDLFQYLDHPGPFKFSPVENVNIVIENGVVTIWPKDPNWVGIEDIVFAPLGVEIKKVILTPEEIEYELARAERRNITVSKYELDTSLGPMIDESFYTIAAGLTDEPVVISGFLAKDEVSLEINDEVSLNISMRGDSASLNPEFSIDVHSSEEGLSLPYYEETTNWLFFLLIGLFVFSVIVVFAYIYSGYAQQVLGALVVHEKKIERSAVSAVLKSDALAGLSALRSELSKDNAKSVLKRSMGAVSSFFSDSLHISFVSKRKIVKKLVKKGNKALSSQVSSLYVDYDAMMYGKVEVTKARVSAFVSKAYGIVRKS